MTAGILAYGAYVPRKRLQRSAIQAANAWFAPGLKGLARGERAIADWDEDTITMAVEAGRDTLRGIERANVGAVALASTTLPFADRQNSGVVKEALTLPDVVGAMDVTGSQRAVTSLLIQALKGASAGGPAQLCLASEMRKSRPASEAELIYGDGAAGVLVGSGEPLATLIGSFSTTIDFVDHYRSAGMDFDYGWETRWIRDEGYLGLIGDALASGLKTMGVEAAAIDRFLAPVAARGVPDALAKRAGVRAEAVADTLAATVGDTGTAHPLLMLAGALEAAEPGETILVMGFGQGVDLIALKTTAALAELAPRRGVSGVLARGVKDENYLRWLFHRGLLDLERGMRAEADQKQPGTTLYRHRKAVLGLVGGRCRETGTVQFPKSDISVSSNARAAHTQEDYPLAERRARIVTYTADALTYSPAPPSYYGAIDFEGGGRMTVEFADACGDEVQVGREMEMVFRIKDIDQTRDFTKYFWKAAPVLATAAGEA